MSEHTVDAIKQCIRDFVSETANRKLDAQDDTAALAEDFGLDSLDLTQLAMKLEDTYDIKIQNADYPELQTIERAALRVEALTRHQTRSAANVVV